MTQSARTNAVAEAIDFLGGDTAVARLAGLKTSWAVAKWRKKLPPDRVIWLSEQTGWRFAPHALSPAIYPNPLDGIPPGMGTASCGPKHGRRSTDKNQ